MAFAIFIFFIRDYHNQTPISTNFGLYMVLHHICAPHFSHCSCGYVQTFSQHNRRKILFNEQYLRLFIIHQCTSIYNISWYIIGKNCQIINRFCRIHCWFSQKLDNFVLNIVESLFSHLKSAIVISVKNFPIKQKNSPSSVLLICIANIQNREHFHVFAPIRANKWACISPFSCNALQGKKQAIWDLKGTKAEDTQPKPNVVCFVLQPCQTDVENRNFFRITVLWVPI